MSGDHNTVICKTLRVALIVSILECFVNVFGSIMGDQMCNRICYVNGSTN